jgi:transposase
MKNTTTYGIDLAKRSIQVTAVSASNIIKRNQSVSPNKLRNLLATHRPAKFVFEACGSAHYWARIATGHGHEAIILPSQFVAGSRQGQKTDANDALACAVASKHPKAKPVTIKTEEEQGLQAVERALQGLTKQSTAQNNLLIGLLFEFGITLAKRSGEVLRRLPDILEDAENGIPHFLRETLALSADHYREIRYRLAQVKAQHNRLVKQQLDCKRLLSLEGVGPMSAMGLYMAIGDGHAFKHGREASACIGVTPKQYSTGGKVKIGTVGKKRGNQRLRYTLFQGAMSVVKQLKKRPPRTVKEKWFMDLIERRGERCAAMAYANKTVRTAWAMLRHQTTYEPILLPPMPATVH